VLIDKLNNYEESKNDNNRILGNLYNNSARTQNQSANRHRGLNINDIQSADNLSSLDRESNNILLNIDSPDLGPALNHQQINNVVTNLTDVANRAQDILERHNGAFEIFWWRFKARLDLHVLNLGRQRVVPHGFWVEHSWWAAPVGILIIMAALGGLGYYLGISLRDVKESVVAVSNNQLNLNQRVDTLTEISSIGATTLNELNNENTNLNRFLQMRNNGPTNNREMLAWLMLFGLAAKRIFRF